MCTRPYRNSLLEDTPEEEVEEMEAAVKSSLTATEGASWQATESASWQVLKAGGAARGRSSHDADFVITCEGSTRSPSVHAPDLFFTNTYTHTYTYMSIDTFGRGKHVQVPCLCPVVCLWPDNRGRVLRKSLR